MRSMRFDRLGAEGKAGCDAFAGVTLRNQLKHFPLAGRQRLGLHRASALRPSADIIFNDRLGNWRTQVRFPAINGMNRRDQLVRSEEHTSELQSRGHLVCRLLLEKKK